MLVLSGFSTGSLENNSQARQTRTVTDFRFVVFCFVIAIILFPPLRLLPDSPPPPAALLLRNKPFEFVLALAFQHFFLLKAAAYIHCL